MKKLLSSVTVVILFIFFACKHLPPEVPVTAIPGTPPPGTTGNNGGNGGGSSSKLICFESDVLPIFQSNCAKSGCHDAASNQDGYILNSYENLFKKDGKINSNNIRPYNSQNSELYKILFETGNKKMPPPPDPDLTAAQKNIIARWINEGAFNTANCNSSCDSAHFEFAAHIQPILQNYCTGCHSGPNPPNGVDLSSYTGVKSVSTNGLLYGVIAHLPGYDPMPKGTGKLPDCEIAQIRKWTLAGSPNN